MGHQQKLSSSQPPQPPTHPPSAMHSFKLAFALALVAATMAAASAARQIQQIDIPEAGILEAGINIGSEVFVPSVSFLDVGSIFSGLLQGPIGAAGGFLDEGLQPLYDGLGAITGLTPT